MILSHDNLNDYYHNNLIILIIILITLTNYIILTGKLHTKHSQVCHLKLPTENTLLLGYQEAPSD